MWVWFSPSFVGGVVHIASAITFTLPPQPQVSLLNGFFFVIARLSVGGRWGHLGQPQGLLADAQVLRPDVTATVYGHCIGPLFTKTSSDVVT